MCSGLSAIEVWCPICGDGMQPRKGGTGGKGLCPKCALSGLSHGGLTEGRVDGMFCLPFCEAALWPRRIALPDCPDVGRSLHTRPHSSLFEILRWFPSVTVPKCGDSSGLWGSDRICPLPPYTWPLSPVDNTCNRPLHGPSFSLQSILYSALDKTDI